MKQSEPKKRNYVKRKRSLSESTKIILSTLQLINSNSPNPVDNNELTHIAINHAKAIEATCWSRRAKFSDEIFQTIIRTKTAELCQTLLSSQYSGLLVLSKNSESSLSTSTLGSSSQNRNVYFPVNQPKNNNILQQRFIISSSNDSPSTSPSTNTFNSTTSINESNNYNKNSMYTYPPIQSYPLPPSDIQVPHSSIPPNAITQVNSSSSSQFQQSQIKQPYFTLSLNQVNKDYDFNGNSHLNILYDAQAKPQKNIPVSEMFSASPHLLKHPVVSVENEDNSSCCNKSTPKIKFPSISSLLS